MLSYALSSTYNDRETKLWSSSTESAKLWGLVRKLQPEASFSW